VEKFGIDDPLMREIIRGDGIKSHHVDRLNNLLIKYLELNW